MCRMCATRAFTKRTDQNFQNGILKNAHELPLGLFKSFGLDVCTFFFKNPFIKHLLSTLVLTACSRSPPGRTPSFWAARVAKVDSPWF